MMRVLGSSWGVYRPLIIPATTQHPPATIALATGQERPSVNFPWEYFRSVVHVLDMIFLTALQRTPLHGTDSTSHWPKSAKREPSIHHLSCNQGGSLGGAYFAASLSTSNVK